MLPATGPSGVATSETQVSPPVAATPLPLSVRVALERAEKYAFLAKRRAMTSAHSKKRADETVAVLRALRERAERYMAAVEAHNAIAANPTTAAAVPLRGMVHVEPEPTLLIARMRAGNELLTLFIPDGAA